MTEQLIHSVEFGDREAQRRIRGVTDSVLLFASIAAKLPGLHNYEQQGNYLMMDEEKRWVFQGG